MPKARRSASALGELVAGAQGAIAGEADAAAGGVGEVDADRADVAEFEHRALVVAAGAGEPGAAEGEGGEGGLEQEALGLPLVDVIALHHAVPAADLLLVAGADPAGGVDVEVAADLAAAEARAQQQLGRAQGSTGDDRRSPGADGEGAAPTDRRRFGRAARRRRRGRPRPGRAALRRRCAAVRPRQPPAAGS